MEEIIDHEKVSRLSARMLSHLHAARLSTGEGLAVLAISLGRLASPKVPLDAEEEVAYLNDVLEWTAAYFAEGGMN